MSVEAERGCGFRKVGGTYLVCEGTGFTCLKMPANLDICPCCSQGIKFARGWTWVNAKTLFEGDCVQQGIVTERPRHCKQSQAYIDIHAFACPFDDPHVGLLWIGQKFYTPESFIEEAHRMGISKRINAVPKDFQVGRDWVLLAHKKAGKKEVWEQWDGKEPLPLEVDLISANSEEKTCILKEKVCPAIFFAFRPTRIEKIMTQPMIDKLTEKQKLLDEKKNIHYVIVPEDDPDHQGTVYDKDEDEADGFDKALDELERMGKDIDPPDAPDDDKYLEDPDPMQIGEGPHGEPIMDDPRKWRDSTDDKEDPEQEAEKSEERVNENSARERGF